MNGKSEIKIINEQSFVEKIENEKTETKITEQGVNL